MKKLLLLIVLFITATLQAQEISYGVKAGLNLSYLRLFRFFATPHFCHKMRISSNTFES